jgi:hypothetical protein
MHVNVTYHEIYTELEGVSTMIYTCIQVKFSKLGRYNGYHYEVSRGFSKSLHVKSNILFRLGRVKFLENAY